MTSAHEFHGPYFSTPTAVPVFYRGPDDAPPAPCPPSAFHAALQKLVDEARTLIGAHYAAVRILLDDAEVISAVSVSEKLASWRTAHVRAIGTGVASLVYPLSRPVRMTSEEMLAHPIWRTIAAGTKDRPPMRGWLAIPLLDRDGKNVGLFDLTDKCQGEFSRDDEYSLMRLAQAALRAVDNSELASPMQRDQDADDGDDSDDTLYLSTDTLVVAPREKTLASPSHAVITTNADEIITDWNPGAEELFGYPRAAAIGQTIRMLVPGEYLADHQEIQKTLRSSGSANRAETVRRRRGGKTVDLHLSAFALHDADGKWLGALTVAHDLAEAKSLEQQYRQAQRMEAFGQLAGGIAHDFNNLLTVILGYAEVLMRRFPADDAANELLTEIHKAGSRAETLTRQLLTFSRKQVFEMKVLDLNAVVGDTERMLRRLIGEDILTTIRFAPTLGRVKIDPGQMQQVILNLTINARDAMPKGGRLTIETANVVLDSARDHENAAVRRGNFVMLEVSDTGIGMNAATKARIFEPLFTTKAPGKGTGLGLATVQSIVKQCGGHIEVHSEFGRGSSFKVYLPQVQETLALPAPPGDVPMFPRGDETILLVEDEDCVRNLTRQVLEMCGYTVLEASHGEEALRLFEALGAGIHLLVTDVIMPYLDGPSLADRLRANNPQLKVLFLSGHPDETVIRHGVLNTALMFLQKPFSTSALAQKVRLILDQRASEV